MDKVSEFKDFRDVPIGAIFLAHDWDTRLHLVIRTFKKVSNHYAKLVGGKEEMYFNGFSEVEVLK
jgi:hypothetical protein